MMSTPADECYGSSRSLVCAISQAIFRRRYGMLAWVKRKSSSPRESASKNWQVNTPQSKPFSCCGVSWRQSC